MLADGAVLADGGMVAVDAATEVEPPFDEPDEHPTANTAADANSPRREIVGGAGIPVRSIAAE